MEKRKLYFLNIKEHFENVSYDIENEAVHVSITVSKTLNDSCHYIRYRIRHLDKY